MDTQQVEPSSEEIDAASEMLQLISDPTRLKILWALLHGEHPVNELAEHVGARPAAVSQHLAKLRIGRLVKTRRAGNKIYYSTDNVHIHKLITQALSQAKHIVGDKRYEGAKSR